MLPQLNKPGVHMKDRNHVLSVVRNMINNGAQRLQVVSDFDMTLSRFVDADGLPCSSCYHVLEHSKKLPLSYREKALALKNQYYAIEVDPKMTTEEKIPYMVEWWTKAHDLLLPLNLRQEYIAEMVSESRVFFRDGCDWLFDELHKYHVPILILSAGIGDVIVEVIKQRAVLHDNVRVVSNFMDFDDQGVLKGFKGDLLHVFNKNENAIHKSDYFELFAHRDSIILMGDSLGDLHMADGAGECTNQLKIGFLNDFVEERLPIYMESYDIVLVNDQTMEIPNAIIQLILENNVSSHDHAVEMAT